MQKVLKPDIIQWIVGAPDQVYGLLMTGRTNSKAHFHKLEYDACRINPHALIFAVCLFVYASDEGFKEVKRALFNHVHLFIYFLEAIRG